GNEINVPVYVNEHANYNKAMIDVNKISTVFGREGFREYINRQIEKKNLVRIKIRNTQNSDPNALIAKRYEKDVSNTIIAQNSQKSTSKTKKVSESDGIVDRKSLDDNLFDKDSFFANAMENGGVISHEEAEKMRGNRKPEPEKSQTAENKPKAKSKSKAKTKKQLAAEVKELKKDNRGLKKANDKLAESVSRTQSANAELRKKNRDLDSKMRNRKSAEEKYEKKFAHEQEKMERETAEGLNRESSALMRITRIIDFFKNEVLHRKYTDGAVEGAKILSDPGIRAFAEIKIKFNYDY
ncbi:MAG: hypothetical protein IJW79_06645, partial [Clostridia bacterium]|nr:hypothetical protein [Clostridia bacterium]